MSDVGETPLAARSLRPPEELNMQICLRCSKRITVEGAQVRRVSVGCSHANTKSPGLIAT